MERKYAEYLLKKTYQDYNLIAEDYTRTRSFIPEDIKMLAGYALVGERVLDSGCANGRLFEVLKGKNVDPVRGQRDLVKGQRKQTSNGVDYFGIDFSEKLIEIARKKYPQAKFRVADCLNLPFPANFFDKIYSISVLHNIPAKEFRIQYLKEARRVLKPEGFLILRVWDFWRRKEGWKLFFKYTFLKLVKKSKLDFFDIFVPWKDSKGNIIIERYFHCFRKNELENLAKEVGFKIKKIWRAGKDPRTNIYLIAEK
jgi:ubiquinone/menaquinone biosynthesis C-methylase UbiE